MAVNSSGTSKRSEFPGPKFEESLPVVFQCNNCNNILGDSYAWISSNRDLEVICLSKVTPFIRSGECLETSTTESDIGSSPIGRIYQTTPKDLDHLRNQYCLDMEHIRSYQVGSEDGMQTLPAEEVLGIPTAKVLQQGIHKIESVVLMLLERLTLLEKEVKGNKANMEDDETNLTATGSDSARETQKESDSAKQNRKRRK
ncbi:protein Mis18-alpha-like isoform X2 [Stylophora pistillata]|uniref:protein Mis18-alpha-like isoform X2 n=1 Tax=Stylophora pistillata TaxID=50429 RepID=UPI000C03EF7A|nr:protein Mis18-alpha-like isoform X2 [Stylophora pistillata]